MNPSTRLPYPGLRAFSREESDLFFGRDGCVTDMVNRLAATRFLSVLGASGSGKSSLVRTGLFDALEIGLYAKAGTRWKIADMHPAGQPMRNLAIALLKARGTESPQPAEIDVLRAFLSRGPRSIVEWCSGGNLEPDWNLLILVDQFEELFRYGDYAQREEAEAFVTLLLESASAKGVPIHVVITMRSEFLGACALIPGLAERINSGLYLTPRMTREECREAIEGPASVARFKVEPALVNRLLNDLSSFAPWEEEHGVDQLQRLSRRADQLPLMQHVLNRLWQRATAEGAAAPIVLTLADYERIGGLRGALDAHGAEIMARLGTAQAPAVEAIFRALVSGMSLASAVRRPCRLRKLITETGEDRDTVVTVLDAFRATDCNFVRPPTPDPLNDDTIIDISHESLIRQWSLLAQWLEKEAGAAAHWRRLLSALEHHERGEGDLLGGLDLANLLAWWEAEKPTAAWAERHGNSYDAARKFINESRRVEEEGAVREKRREVRERNRLRIGVAALGALFVVVSVLGLLAWQSRQQLAETAVALEQKSHEAELQARNAVFMQSVALRAKGDAEAATTRAEDRTKEAELATKQAEASQKSAETANNRAVQAADEFLTNMADRLRLTPGVPKDEVDRLLGKGEEFLAQFSDAVDLRALNQTRARISLSFAEVDLDRGDLPQTRERARGARKIVLGSGEESALSADELVLLGRAYLLEGLAAGRSGESDAARKLFLDGERVATLARAAKPDDPNVLGISADAQYWLSALEFYSFSNNEGGLKFGEACLDFTAKVRPDQLTDKLRVTSANCENLVGMSAANNRDNDRARKAHERAAGAIEAIPRDRWDVQAVRAYALAENNLGWLNEKDLKFAEARPFYGAAADAMRKLVGDDPDNRQARDEYASYLRNLGYMYEQQKQYAAALPIYREAYEARKPLDWHYETAADPLERLSTLLGNLTLSISQDPTYAQDKGRFTEYIDLSKEKVEVDQKAQSLNYQAWRFENIEGTRQRIAWSLLQLTRLTGEDHLAEYYGLVDDIVRGCDTAFTAGTISIYHKSQCLWAVYYLPQNRGDLPLVTDPAIQIGYLERSRAHFDWLLGKDPDRNVWSIEDRFGAVSTDLAQLYAKVGRPDDALKAAEASAALHIRSGIELLADWYSTGSGPVPADAEKAALYKEQLTAPNSGLWSFTFPVDLKWTNWDDEWPENVYFRDPRFPGENPLERMIYQLENYEGEKLPDARLSDLRAIWQTSVDERRSFIEVLFDRAGAANTPEGIANALRDSIKRGDSQATAQYLYNQTGMGNGTTSVDEGVRKYLLSVNQSPEVRKRIQTAAEEVLFNNSIKAKDGSRDDAAIVILTALIDTSSGDPDELADLRYRRGIAHANAGEPGPAESDLAVAVSLAPERADILNSLAYNWLEADKQIPAATRLLERASALSPKSAPIRDSLGWAYAKGGDVEKALPLLQSAVAEMPYLAEHHAHLADAYRRLGRNDEAKHELDEALANKPTDRVRKFIDDQLALMGLAPSGEGGKPVNVPQN